MSSESSNVSIVRTLTEIVDKRISTTLPKTENRTLLFSTGSNLTPINLGKLSY